MAPYWSTGGSCWATNAQRWTMPFASDPAVPTEGMSSTSKHAMMGRDQPARRALPAEAEQRQWRRVAAGHRGRSESSRYYPSAVNVRRIAS